MSLQSLRSMFEHLNDVKNWTLEVVQINASKKNGTSYVGREIIFEPQNKLNEFISEIAEYYVGNKGSFDNKYIDLVEYDGSTNGKTIYHLSGSNNLIKEEFNLLINALAIPNVEIDPFDMRARATAVCGTFTNATDEIIPIKLISMQNPITVLKHKFLRNNGTFKEISNKVLSLRPTIDVMIIGEDIYFLTLAGENLFNMERSYKALCKDYIAIIGDSGILSDIEMFTNIASYGHNPRRFVSYNQKHLEKLKNVQTRKRIAKKFSIPLKTDGKIDTSQEGVSEKVVKILCDKGMVDPFEDIAMEVSSAKKWE